MARVVKESGDYLRTHLRVYRRSETFSVLPLSQMAHDSLTNATSVDGSRPADAAMATVYGIIFVGGLIGHGLVLLVVVRDRHQRSRAVSNSYIASLSVADIGFLLGLPFIIATLTARRWLFGVSLCKVVAFQ